MKAIGAIIGYMLLIGSALLQFFFYISALNKWLGVFGVILGFIFSPGVIIFPLLFWLIEKVFPAFYFIVWGIGFFGLVIVGISMSAGKSQTDY